MMGHGTETYNAHSWHNRTNYEIDDPISEVRLQCTYLTRQVNRRILDERSAK